MMLLQDNCVSLYDMSMFLSATADMVSPAIFNHHKRVALIALSIAQELNLDEDSLQNVVMASLLHDIGALSLAERIELLQFEERIGKVNPYHHAEAGYMLLRDFSPLARAAEFIRYHHDWWDGSGRGFGGESIPLESHVIHLADRIDILSRERDFSLNDAPDVTDAILRYRGTMFSPDVVDAFTRLAEKEYFWFQLSSQDAVIRGRKSFGFMRLNLSQLLELSGILCQIIDFRSRFTSTHSSGVAAASERMAGLLGYSAQESRMMKLAGYLHDLGKLAVPPEIIDKPSSLTPAEYVIIKKHPYLTYRMLGMIENLEVINLWASLHHERVDGSGYPFHVGGEELYLGSRIIAVTDVFVALTENRPYRKAMEAHTAVKVLKEMSASARIDGSVVEVLSSNFDEIDGIRRQEQEQAFEHYIDFERNIYTGNSIRAN